jgi:hypothetical protein
VSIILPRRHYTQPQGRVRVEWNHPISTGLVFAFDPAGRRNAADGTPMTQTGGAFVVASDRGVALQATDSARVFSCPITPIAATAPVSGYFHARAYASNATRKRLFRLFNATNGTIVNIDFGSGSSNRSFTGIQTASDFPTNGIFSNTPIGNNIIYGGHDGGSTFDAFVFELNGVIGTDTFGTAGARIGPATDLNLGNNASSFPWNGEIPIAYLWRRMLSVEERRELDANPWQLFRADPVRIYSLPSAAPGVPTSLLNQNLAATSFRSAWTAPA